MKDTQGLFIVIEGTDGSGKGTQFKKLVARLEEAGHDVATFDFPQYDQPSSYFVKEYLNGQYGSADEVGPYTASLFYALDRYEAAPAIRQALKEGKVVIANRFTGSNMAHQGTKFSHAEQRRGYFIWLDNLEFQMLNIPRPAQSIVLRVPADIAQELVDHKETRSYTDKKRDIHEADLSHLQRAVEVYDDLCQLFPKDFTRIDCVRSGKLLDIDEVGKLVWEKIYPLLPAVPEKSPSRNKAAKKPGIDASQHLYTPALFDTETATLYQRALASILQKREELLDKLDETDAEHELVAQLLLPVAAAGLTDRLELNSQSNLTLAALAKEADTNYSEDGKKSASLIDYWPRNELSIVPELLYSYSNVPLSQIADRTNHWPYSKKAEVLTAFVRSDKQVKVDNVRYVVDGVTEYAAAQALVQAGLQVEHQQLTPRYGYDVPAVVTDPWLIELYEDCFDMSLQLYSQLQAAGYAAEASYAALLGHKLRVKVTLDYAALRQLHDLAKQPVLHTLVANILEVIAEVHPLLAVAGQQTAKAKATPNLH